MIIDLKKLKGSAPFNWNRSGDEIVRVHVGMNTIKKFEELL